MRTRRQRIAILAATAVLAAVAAPTALATVQQRPPAPGDPAARVCAQLEQNLGAERFAQKFGSQEGCVAKLGPAAREAAAQCRSAHEPGTPDFQQCMKDEMQPAVRAIVGDPAEGAATVAKMICTNIQKRLGAQRFKLRFGDVAACVKEIEPKAKSAITLCSKAHKPKSPEHKKCMSEKIKAHVITTGMSKAAETIAANACKQARSKLGADKFQKRFGSHERCVAKLLPRAEAAAKACKSEGDPGSRPYKACVQKAIQQALRTK